MSSHRGTAPRVTQPSVLGSASDSPCSGKRFSHTYLSLVVCINQCLFFYAQRKESVIYSLWIKKVNDFALKTMALPIYPIPKPSSRRAPRELSRSQSLNLHDAKNRTSRKMQLDNCEFQKLNKTGGTLTLPTHRRKRISDTEHEEQRHRSEFSGKFKLFFRRKSNKGSREGGIDVSDVTSSDGLFITGNEGKRESGSEVPTQAVNLRLSRHIMTNLLLDQNTVDITCTSKDHSSHRSTRWYDGDDEERESKLQCCDLEGTPSPALGESGLLICEQDIKTLSHSTLEDEEGFKTADRGIDSNPQSPSASQLFTISEECVEDELSHHTSVLTMGAGDSEDAEICTSTPAVVLRRVAGFLSGDGLMNRWSITGSGIHDSQSLRESEVHDAWHEPTLSKSDVVALGRDSDSGEDSSKDEVKATDEDSRTHGSSDSVLCDIVDQRMNTSQSMLELPHCMTEETLQAEKKPGLRRSASLTLSRSQKLVLQVSGVVHN